MSKIKRFFRQTGLTKAQLISSLLCYFLCFALFLGIVVIWNPLSLSSTPTEDSQAADGPTNPDGYWTDEGRYDTTWYTSGNITLYGDGSESNPYKISTAAQLAGLSYLVYNNAVESSDLTTSGTYNYIFLGKYFEQTAKIDLSAYYWQPIGINYTREGRTRRNYFSGSYDGGGHTVSGVFTPAGSDDEYSYQGLFGRVYSSSSSNPVTIQNLGAINSLIQGYQYVGGVVGYAGSNTTISNCYNRGAVSGSDDNVGGVVGYASGSTTITNCYNTGSVTGSRYVGGVVGDAYASGSTTITNCYNTGSVTGSGSFVGGVVGEANAHSSTFTITNCYNTGAVSGSSYVGGVVGDANGYSSTITITNCYNTGSVSGSLYVGGVVGSVSSGGITITNCYYGGGVTGTLGRHGTYLSNLVNLAKTEIFFSPFAGRYVSGTWSTYWATGEGTAWDFFTVWKIDANLNNGYPSFREESEIVGFWTDHVTVTSYGGGNGTQSSPYQISNAQQLALLAKNVNSGTDYSGTYFKQTADINLSGYLWDPIGRDYDRYGVESLNRFAGNYDGAGFKVIEISTSNLLSHQGLFGSATGSITRVNISDSNINGYQYVGGVVGMASGAISITECKNSATIVGVANDSYVGGVVGYASSYGTIPITNCYNTGTVTGSGSRVGGVVGYVAGATIANCYNTGAVSGSSRVGGVVGYASGATITNCYNTDSVSGSLYVGGVVGEASGSTTITNCYNTGSVSGSSSVGGVAGYASGATITNCYNTGSVSGSSYADRVGGVVGRASDTITITNCYNTGSVSGYSYVGGVVGHASSSPSSGTITITNCYNTGAVSGSSDVGGVVGYVAGATIANCYNTGDVTGGSSAGGVVGYAYASSTTGCNISKSANFGDITVTGSSGRVGGIVGYVRVTNSSYSFKMTNCYSEGSITVSGTNVTVGGFVGSLSANYSTYSNVKIEFCSVDLDIVVSGGSASQGAFYGGTKGLTVENSYSLLTSGGAVNKVISAVQTNMDNNFGYMLNFKEGKPIPLGIFHILDVATRTGIVNRINAL